MRIHFNWQIIRRLIKDAKSGGGARDATSERIQLCKRSRERTSELPAPVIDRLRMLFQLHSDNLRRAIIVSLRLHYVGILQTFTPFTRWDVKKLYYPHNNTFTLCS